jgi:hypothetical protein
MASSMKRPRRAVTAVLAMIIATAVGFTSVAEPASAAYAPTVHLAKHRVHRGHHDRAVCRHFAKNHRGTVSVRQGGTRHVLKVFHTGPRGGARFRFFVPRWLHVGRHWLLFRTGHKHARVRIRVLR